MDPEWNDILTKASSDTHDAYAGKVSSLTSLTDDEVKEITPTPADRERFAKLIGIVADATKQNNEKADAIRNTAGLVEMAVDVVGKLTKVI